MAKTAAGYIFRTVMKKLFLSFLLFPVFAYGQNLPKPFLSYKIEGELDTAKKEFSGSCLVRLENRTNQTLDKLVFNLYPNAFRNSNTTFQREKAGLSQGGKALLDSGFLTVEKVTDAQGVDLTSGAKLDETIFTVPLKTPLHSGQTGTVELKFKTHFPRPVERIGWTKEDIFIFAQWYPILAVLQPDGNFAAYSFHYNSEFFSDFADYEVSITIPKGFNIEATGYPVGDSATTDKKIVRFKAQTVVDFAAVASPKFKNSSRIFQGIYLTFFGMPRPEAEIKEGFTMAESTLSYCGRTYGSYPYKKLVIADAPVGSGNGMEFPMLVTIDFGSFPFGGGIGKLLLRDAIVHEVVHQWWYQLVATNQFTEPWLDEGFTTYTTSIIIDRLNQVHPTFLNRLGIDLSRGLPGQISLRRSGSYDSLASRSWEFFSTRTYLTNVYSKTSLLLQTIENHIGPVRMNILLQTYFEKYRFSHPSGKDFLKIAADFVPDSILNPLTKWLYGPPPICDFAVGNFASEKVRDKLFKGRLELFNRGDINFPVGVRITFENGFKKDTTWLADKKAVRWEISGPAKIQSVEINPDRRIALETDFTNNFKTISRNVAGAWAMLWRMIYGMESVASWMTAL